MDRAAEANAREPPQAHIRSYLKISRRYELQTIGGTRRVLLRSACWSEARTSVEPRAR